MLNKEIKWKSAEEIEQERLEQEEERQQEEQKRQEMENAVERVKQLEEIIDIMLNGGDD